jgi:acyl-CoA thioester hydrolase
VVASGHDVVVAEANLRFRAPARFDEELDIAMAVKHLGKTSLVVQPEFRVGDRLVVDGEVRHVFVDPATLGKKSMPDDIRTALASSA